MHSRVRGALACLALVAFLASTAACFGTDDPVTSGDATPPLPGTDGSAALNDARTEPRDAASSADATLANDAALGSDTSNTSDSAPAGDAGSDANVALSDAGDGGTDAGPTSVPAPTCFTTFGGTDADSIAGVTTNATSHTVAVYGSYYGTPDYGTGPLPVSTSQAPKGFVAFFNETCTLQSVAIVDDGVARVRVDPSGNYWVLPRSSIPVTAQGPMEMYIRKYSSTGQLLANRRVATATAPNWVGVRPVDFAIDTQGDLVIVGRYGNIVTFPGPNGPTINGANLGYYRESQYFLVKYAGATFNHLWNRKVVAYPPYQQPNAPFGGGFAEIEPTSSDDFLLRGSFYNGGMTLGGGIPDCVVNEDRAFILRGAAVGGAAATAWGFSTLKDAYAGMSPAKDGVVAFAGKVLGSDKDFGQGTIPMNSGFVAALDENTGTSVWSYAVDKKYFATGVGITPVANGTYVMTGVTTAKEAYFAHVTSAGMSAPVLIQPNGGNSLLPPSSAVTSGGQTAIVGTFNATLDYGAHTATSAGKTDVYLMMFP